MTQSGFAEGRLPFDQAMREWVQILLVEPLGSSNSFEVCRRDGSRRGAILQKALPGSREQSLRFDI